MDITNEVMLPPRGASDFSQSANPKWLVLAPVAVYLRKTPSVIGMPNTGYLHVDNVPDPQGAVTDEEKLIKLNAILCEQRFQQVLVGVQPEMQLVERRAFRGNPDLLPPPVKNALLTDRQASITWGQCKALFRHVGRGQNLADGDF